MAAVAASLLVGIAPASAQSAAGWPKKTAVETDRGCRLVATVVYKPSQHRYTFSGGATCTKKRKMELWCFPVHKHSRGWHSHTHDISRNGPRTTKRLTVSQSNIKGTNADRYKINCKLKLDNSDSKRVVVETASFRL